MREHTLRAHIKLAHAAPKPVNKIQENWAPYTFICEHCAQPYTSQAALEKHIQSKHMEQKRVNCQICNASLSQFSLYAHMLNIHSSKPKQCPHCDKVSPNPAALVISCSFLPINWNFILNDFFETIFQTNHLREVHKQADLKCSFCDRSFKTPRALRGHEATHTGFKEHKCKYCKHAFTHKSSMYCHQKKVHPDEWKRNKSNQRNYETPK